MKLKLSSMLIIIFVNDLGLHQFERGMHCYSSLVGPLNGLTATGPVRLARDDAYGSPLSTTLKGTIQQSYKPKRPPVKYVQPAPVYQPETVYYKDTHSAAPSYSAPGSQFNWIKLLSLPENRPQMGMYAMHELLE